MAYPVSIMIGVCVGDVFPWKHTEKSKKALQDQILIIAKNIVLENTLNDTIEVPCEISDILGGRKGDYMVMAGVYNSFSFGTASLIAKAISKELECESMIMAYDCTGQTIECMVYQNGEPKSSKPICGFDE